MFAEVGSGDGLSVPYRMADRLDAHRLLTIVDCRGSFFPVSCLRLGYTTVITVSMPSGLYPSFAMLADAVDSIRSKDNVSH